MSTWSLKQIPAQPGRVALITGANSGIGYETALELAKKDISVILVCRSASKAEAAKQKILQVYGRAQLTIMVADMASLASVKAFATQFLQDHTRLDLLINNAGIMMSPYKRTQDGFEEQLATNYIGHFALTGLLLPLLIGTAGSRVVMLSSLAYKWTEINFDDLHGLKNFSKRTAYGQSKRACLIFAYELNRRLAAGGYGTISLAAHPGVSKTNLFQYGPAFLRPLGSLFMQPPSKGALPTLFAALCDGLAGAEFIGPDGFGQMSGNPVVVNSDVYSKNKGVAARLWQVSQDMTKVCYLE